MTAERRGVGRLLQVVVQFPQPLPVGRIEVGEPLFGPLAVPPC